MRLKVYFDTKLKLGDHSRVVVAIPPSVERVADLIQYLRDTFDIPESSTGPLSISIEEFLITPDQLVSDVLRNDDVIIVQPKRLSGSPSAGPATPENVPSRSIVNKRPLTDDTPILTEEPSLKLRKEEVMELILKLEEESEQHSVSEPTVNPVVSVVQTNDNTETVFERESVAKEEPLPDHLSVELRPGDEIRFVSPNADCATHAIVRSVEKDPTSGEETVVFTGETGSWESMRLLDLVDLSIVSRPTTGDMDEFIIRPKTHIPEPEVKFEPDEADLKRVQSWRDRQRRKCISALRRQIEWIVKEEGSVGVPDLANRDRVKDLTDMESDVMEAVLASNKLCFDEVSNTIKLVV